jgi:hypothetical protein
MQNISLVSASAFEIGMLEGPVRRLFGANPTALKLLPRLPIQLSIHPINTYSHRGRGSGVTCLA